MDAVRVLDDPGTATVVLDPVRRSVLTALREPASAAALSGTLGITRQRIAYYLRSLEEHGLVTQVEQRQWGGITERIYAATASSYVVSTEALGEAGVSPRRLGDGVPAQYLVALAAQAVRDVGVLLRRATTQRRPLATLSLNTVITFASAADRAHFADELGTTVRALAARYHSPTARRGRDHHVVVLAYPTTEETG